MTLLQISCNHLIYSSALFRTVIRAMLAKLLLVLALTLMVEGKGGSCKKMDKKISKLTKAFTKKCVKPGQIKLLKVNIIFINSIVNRNYFVAIVIVRCNEFIR